MDRTEIDWPDVDRCIENGLSLPYPTVVALYLMARRMVDVAENNAVVITREGLDAMTEQLEALKAENVALSEQNLVLADANANLVERLNTAIDANRDYALAHIERGGEVTLAKPAEEAFQVRVIVDPSVEFEVLPAPDTAKPAEASDA